MILRCFVVFVALGGCARDPSLVFGPVPTRSDAGAPDAATYCSSGRTRGASELADEHMLPGQVCTQCHVLGGDPDAPHFTIAGTIYPTLHEPDDCISDVAMRDARVEIEDADGHHLVLVPNAVGNFFTDEPVTFPYRASITLGSRTRAMVTPQRAGDCNACHTALGRNDAPGRVLAP